MRSDSDNVDAVTAVMRELLARRGLPVEDGDLMVSEIGRKDGPRGRGWTYKGKDLDPDIKFEVAAILRERGLVPDIE